MIVPDNLIEYALTYDRAQWVRRKFVRYFFQAAIFVAHFTWHDAGIRWDLRLQLGGKWQRVLLVLLAVFHRFIPTRSYGQLLLSLHLVGKAGALGVLWNQLHVDGLSKALAGDGCSHVQVKRVIGLNTPIVRLVPSLRNLTPVIGVRTEAGIIGCLVYCLQLPVYSLEWSVFFLDTSVVTIKRGSRVRLLFLASYFRLGLFLYCLSTKLI